MNGTQPPTGADMPARTLLLPSNELVPSVILRKLAAAGAGNALSRALRALGRIERTQFTLQWLSDPALRQRSHAGLNKGEASNALRRAVFFHRQGKIRDRTFENQSFRASGLSQGCSTLSTEAPLEECVDTAESGGISILIER
jgi:TnpA family transposase